MDGVENVGGIEGAEDEHIPVGCLRLGCRQADVFVSLRFKALYPDQTS